MAILDFLGDVREPGSRHATLIGSALASNPLLAEVALMRIKPADMRCRRASRRASARDVIIRCGRMPAHRRNPRFDLVLEIETCDNDRNYSLFGILVRLMRFAIVMLAVLAAAPAVAADAVVKDGRTIELGPVTFRLDGIDAPDFDQICIDEHADPWACGVEARDQLAKQIDRRGVNCESLGPDKTYPKWSSGICTVAGEPTSLNQSLVRQGYALAVAPQAKADFKPDETAAKADRRGLWRGCFVAPQDFRRGDKQGALLGAACPSDKERELRATLFPDEPAMPPGCTIKAKFAVRARATGHVGIYHLQGCRSYSSLTKPNRWFCSEEDAQAERFRRAYNCRAKK